MTKLLIIGATGQVASSLLEKNFHAVSQMVALEPPELDITDAASIKTAIAAVSPDMVVNAAAYTAVDMAEENANLAFTINRDGPACLARECAARGIPLVHISTDYVYDGSKEGMYIESDPVAPLGVYGHSKYEGDLAVRDAYPKHIILRTAWIYSPFGQNFVKTMLRLAKTRDVISVVDDQIGCPSYAPHIADGILQVVERLAADGNNAPWGVYNLAGAGETSWCGFARKIFEQSRVHGGPEAVVHAITTDAYPTPAKRPANSRLDCSKFERTFGSSLPNWQQGTADCVSRLITQT